MDEELERSNAGGGSATAADGSESPMAPVTVGPPAPDGPARRSGVALVVGAVVVVVIAVVGIAVGTSSGSHSGTGPAATSQKAPNAVVLDAIDSTLGAKTADLHLAIAIDVPGAGKITATGDGQVDFSTSASQVSVSYLGMPTAAGGLQMTELFSGGDLYLSMPQIAAVLPGKSWVSQSVGTSSMALGSSNPAGMLQILQNQGDEVTPLGTSDVDDVPVDGYHVVISPAALRNELSGSDLPAGTVQAAESVMGSAGISMDVYVNSSTGLLRRMVAGLHMTLAGQTVSGTVTEDTSNYGVPVSITPPPADQVVSLQQFEQAASSVPGTTSGA